MKTYGFRRLISRRKSYLEAEVASVGLENAEMEPPLTSGSVSLWAVSGYLNVKASPQIIDNCSGNILESLVRRT
jgi:hypothetical protein